tara:strand:+ start:739 stop:3465 length:2727 start_codon:yes stop_codon:yes gene_type:complete
VSEEGINLDFFKKNGFKRQQCIDCENWFWSINEQEKCGDAPCVEYSFFDTPLFEKPMNLEQMREAYLSFFEKKGHSRVDRSSVVARWRDDIYLSIASIAVFQPHVTSGLADPPANPLTISQPCIRLNDLESVGRSGRHLTTFEMMAHHAFNEKETVYWKERTVELCHELYTSLGMKGDALTYKENPWVGGGNGGEALEVLGGGLELATLVFMDLEESDDGDIEMKGIKFKRMSRSIVDTGYGLERMVWASQGTATVYEAILPKTIEYLTEKADLSKELKNSKEIIEENAKVCGLLSIDYGADLTSLRMKVLNRLVEKGYDIELEKLIKIVEPLEKVFAVADHARALAFMFGDGIVPSNVKAGYLARMVVRRALVLLRDLEIEKELTNVVKIQLDDLKNTYPELNEKREHIISLIKLEEKKFEETLEKGRRAVQRTLQKGKINSEKLIELYDSKGLPPAIVKEFALEQGKDVEIPDGFLALVAERHNVAEKKEKEEEKIPEIESTELLFYTNPEDREFSAKVIYSEDKKIALDSTMFYPEGGGQPADKGNFSWEGKKSKVVNVQKIGDIVIHELEGEIPKVKTTVIGEIDRKYRDSLSKHHSATHIVGAAARKILGLHVWQTGAQKEATKARLDITHHERLDVETLNEIERCANQTIMNDYEIISKFLPRSEADKEYGITLYQGGAPKYKNIRIVEIPNIDAQACAGTHVKSTGIVKAVKLMKSERIQDGVERLEFVAGEEALEAARKERIILEEAANILNVAKENVPEAVEKFVKEWKEMRSLVSKLEKQIADMKSEDILFEEIGSFKMYSKELGNVTVPEMQKLSKKLCEEKDSIILLTSVDGEKGSLILSRADNVDINCNDIVKEISEKLEGRGGGSPMYAQSTYPKNKIKEAAKNIVNKIKEKIN